MRPPWLVLLVVLVVATPAVGCPVDPRRRRPWRDDLVVVGTVTAVARRRVDAHGTRYEEVRTALEVEQVLWCDADRPPPGRIFLHSAVLPDLPGERPTLGVGARRVFVLRRTRLADVYLPLAATNPGGPGLRWGLADTTIVGGSLSSGEVTIELRCENPHDVPVTFGGAGEQAILRAGTTRTAVDLGEPLVVPPGRYRTLTLRLRSDALTDDPDAEATLEARSLLLEPTPWEPELRREATPSLAYALDGARWPFPRRERLVPAWLDPDDPALAPPTLRDPLMGLALGLFAALQWTFRRRKSLPGGGAGRLPPWHTIPPLAILPRAGRARVGRHTRAPVGTAPPGAQPPRPGRPRPPGPGA